MLWRYGRNITQMIAEIASFNGASAAAS